MGMCSCTSVVWSAYCLVFQQFYIAVVPLDTESSLLKLLKISGEPVSLVCLLHSSFSVFSVGLFKFKKRDSG